jgi:PAS domain S-box-containing protein
MFMSSSKQTNEASRLSEERYRTLFELSPAAVYTCDSSGVIQEFNRYAAELWGREPVLGDTGERFCGSSTLFHPDGRVLLHEQCPMAQVVSGKISEVRDAEVLIGRPDGSRVAVVVNVHPLKNERGEIAGAVNCFYDITERKHMEEALRESEIRYRRLFESAKDGILILDITSLRITDANPFMTKLLGYPHDEFLGKELWEIGFFRDKGASQAVYKELQQHGYVRYEHLPLETKNGKTAEVEFVSNVYQVGQQFVAQCNIRDISERSRIERKLHQQSEALADLHRRKDEFLAMLSHELRSPLAPISNAVHMLRLQPHEDRLQLQARSIIERQLTLLTRLVDDLMEVARITTGKVQLRHDRVTVSDIVEHAVESVRPLIDQQGHELTLSLPPQAIWLHADATRLEQVIVNLLTNAAKYTDRGGHVWLSVTQEGDECVLRVRDTGVGIAPELLPRIFDLFAQGERSLARSHGGLGIGLALVQKLVEMHRGEVEVLSVLGHGSEFIVRLPMMLSPAQQMLAVPVETAQPTTRSLRVLVVDDNVDMVESLAMLVKSQGHDVRASRDGSATLQAALDYRPEVILLDIGLPGLDGYQVAEQIRKQAALRGVVLVALTGYGQEADRQRSLEAGFDHHLVKPMDFSKLQKIFEIVSGSPSS